MADHDRPADVVTLMWNNPDGTVTTETTDFTTAPMSKTVRVWTPWENEAMHALETLADTSVVVPDQVSIT